MFEYGQGKTCLSLVSNLKQNVQVSINVGRFGGLQEVPSSEKYSLFSVHGNKNLFMQKPFSG